MISSVCIGTRRGRTSVARAESRSRNRVAVDTQCAGTITGQEHRLSRRTPTRQGRGTFRGRSVGVNRPANLFGNAVPQVRGMILERTTGFQPHLGKFGSADEGPAVTPEDLVGERQHRLRGIVSLQDLNSPPRSRANALSPEEGVAPDRMILEAGVPIPCARSTARSGSSSKATPVRRREQSDGQAVRRSLTRSLRVMLVERLRLGPTSSCPSSSTFGRWLPRRSQHSEAAPVTYKNVVTYLSFSPETASRCLD